jgi:hypothetical protein
VPKVLLLIPETCANKAPHRVDLAKTCTSSPNAAMTFGKWTDSP